MITSNFFVSFILSYKSTLCTLQRTVRKIRPVSWLRQPGTFLSICHTQIRAEFYDIAMKLFHVHKHLLEADSFHVGILLSIAGGITDVITYRNRGHVFATAQAGNLVFLGISLTDSEFSLATTMRYLIPVLFFIAGLGITYLFHRRHYKHVHWRQIPLAIEMGLLMVTTFIDGNHNYLAAILTNMAAGIQLAAFKRVNGIKMPTTMVAGDLRNGTEELITYAENKDREEWENGWLYLVVAFTFLCGAIIGNWLDQWWGVQAMWLAVLILGVVWVRLFRDRFSDPNLRPRRSHHKH